MPPCCSISAISSSIFSSICLVSVSMKYEPARGSTVSRMPTSSIRIWQVRRERSAERSVGMP